jgi:hypothetical protein
MERVIRLPDVSWYQVFGFGALIAMYWLVELADLPGAPLSILDPRAWDRSEAVLLTALTLAVAVPSIVRTRRLTSHVHYLEGILRSRGRGNHQRAPEVARLGDGNLTVAWRFALDAVVQSIVRPERAGRIVGGRAFRSPAGLLREEYEVERAVGSRFLADGEDLRSVPLCEGRPMDYVRTWRHPDGAVTVAYRCRDCGGISEMLL